MRWYQDHDPVLLGVENCGEPDRKWHSSRIRTIEWIGRRRRVSLRLAIDQGASAVRLRARDLSSRDRQSGALCSTGFFCSHSTSSTYPTASRRSEEHTSELQS